MSRLAKFLAVMIPVMAFLLACGLGAGPSSEVPPATFAPSVLDPVGTVAQEWKGIPILPQATAGQEFPEKNSYSFKANVTMEDVKAFYNEKLSSLGWSQPYDIPNEEDAALMIFQKENSTLAITITGWEDASVVVLSLK